MNSRTKWITFGVSAGAPNPFGAPVIVWVFVLLAMIAAAGAFLYRQSYFE